MGRHYYQTDTGQVFHTLPGASTQGYTPVVVIDPEDREQVERLAMMCHYGLDPDEMQAALREFADPQPVKPPEPSGFLAIVRDHAGNEWINYRKSWTTVHHETPWVMADDSEEFADYADIAAVEVLFEGVTP